MSLNPALVSLSCVLALAGCASAAIKAYEGPERPKGELAVVQGEFKRDDGPTAVDVQISGVDGVRHPPGKYEARMLPGQHSVALHHTTLGGNRKRSHFCFFDINAMPGCAYRPHPPSPPPPGEAGDWRISVPIPVTILCSDGASFAIRTPGQCSSRDDFPERPKP